MFFMQSHFTSDVCMLMFLHYLERTYCINWCLFKRHISFNATYRSNSATLFAKGCYIENCIRSAKSFYKCSLNMYVSFIVYREHIA